MRKKLITAVALILIMLFAFSIASCAANGELKAEDDIYMPDMGASNESVSKPSDVVTSTTGGDGSKIIKNATVSAETKEYDTATEGLKALIESTGGHVANSSVRENSSYRSDGKTEKRANYEIKIPAEKFDSFLSSLSTIFNITDISTSTEDVSESYFTLQARIETLESKREGLVSMLQHVNVNTDFTTWQKINEELTKIDTELMIYNEQLKSLENKVSYSTVTLSVSEVSEYTETDEKSYGDEIADAFKGSIEAVKKFFQGLLIVIIYLLPFLLISGVTAVVVVLIVRASVKKKKAKRNQNNDDNRA